MAKKINAGTGIASVLLIFVVMCLTTFAVLSLASVRSDSKLTEKNIKESKEYYSAEGKSQEIYSKVDTIVKTAKENSKDITDFYENIKSNKEIANLQVEKSNGSVFLEWSVDVNSLQAIKVKAEALFREKENLKIVSHELYVTKDWEGDDSFLDVYGN